MAARRRDQSVVRCIRDLKSRGFKVVFYPFLLMTASGYPVARPHHLFARPVRAPRRARSTPSSARRRRRSSRPTPVNLTVAYSGSPTDYTYRRMILHYAWLCVVAGGVDLFVHRLGAARPRDDPRARPGRKAGTTDGAGHAVVGLSVRRRPRRARRRRARDLRRRRGCAQEPGDASNLIAYSADWSDWMGWQHAGANGQWPHLDALWASSNIDLVGFDNYLPLSRLDDRRRRPRRGELARSPRRPAPGRRRASTMSGLGLVRRADALLARLSQGQHRGRREVQLVVRRRRQRRPRPRSQRLRSRRLAARGRPAGADAQPLLRQPAACSPTSSCAGGGTIRIRRSTTTATAPAGRRTGRRRAWAPQSKPIAFLEYGFPACDKATNQPNVFFDPKSSDSATPYWSIWDPIPGGGFAPRRDDTIAELALQAIYEYWNVDGHNETSAGGVADGRLRLLLRLGVGRAAVPDLSAAGRANGPTPATGRPAIGSTAAARRCRRPRRRPRRRRATIRPSRRWRRSAGRRMSGRGSPPTSPTTFRGRATRRPSRAAALYDVELTYELLRADAAARRAAGDRRLLRRGRRRGDAVLARAAGPRRASTGRSSASATERRRAFRSSRSFGGYVEPVAGTSGVSAVYLDGVALPASAWSRVRRLRAGDCVCATAPAAGAPSRPTSACCGCAASPTTSSTSRSSWRCCSRSGPSNCRRCGR